nr:WG repeat-containing protein [uncultured Fluviicola sp.]
MSSLQIKILVLFILCAFNKVQAGSIDDAFKALNQFNYFEAKKQFEKSIKSNESAANYGLAVIYSRSDNPFHQLDSAYTRIVRSEKSYGLMKDKQKEALKKYHFDYQAIESLRKEISTGLFRIVLKNPSEEAYDQFQKNNPWAAEQIRAVYSRDSIAYLKSKSANTSAAFDLFLKKYPESDFKKEALNNFYRLQYKENTDGKTISSFLGFEKQFPSNPYVADAQDQVYNLSTARNQVKDYDLFIKTYPKNRNVENAWRKLYQLYMSDYSLERLEKFQTEYPNYPYKDEITKDKKLSSQQIIPYKNAGQFGWMDLNGNIIIPAQYSTVGFFKEGLAWAEKNGKYGFVNKANEIVIPFKFSSANDFDKGRAIVQVDTLFGIIDRSGAYIVEPQYKDIGQFSEGLIYAIKDSLYGYFDGLGFPRIPAQYEEAFSFSGGMAKVTFKGLEGYIDAFGSFRVKPLYESINLFGDSAIVVEGDETAKLANFQGDELKTPPIEEIGTLVSDRALIISDDKIGYLNKKGEVAIPATFDYFTNAKTEGEFVGMYAKVSKANKFGIIDRFGKPIIPFTYSKLGGVSSLIAFEKASKWGYINLQNQVVVPPMYEAAESFKSGLGVIQLLTLKGAINAKGETVIPVEHTTIKALDESHFLVSLGAFYGIYTNKGKLVVPLEYVQIRKVQDDFYILTKGTELHYFYVPENKLIKPILD